MYLLRFDDDDVIVMKTAHMMMMVMILNDDDHTLAVSCVVFERNKRYGDCLS